MKDVIGDLGIHMPEGALDEIMDEAKKDNKDGDPKKEEEKK